MNPLLQKPAKPAPRPPVGPTAQKMPPRRSLVWFALILLLNYLMMRNLFPDADDPVKIPYTLFKEQAISNNVEAIYSRGESITARFLKPVPYPAPKSATASADTPKPSRPLPRPREARNFATTLPAFVDAGLEALLIEHDVE